MLLRRLVLEDFGVFRDRNELDLGPRLRYGQRRPVVLIGGKNGCGKTTILEALRLCLYGPLALGTRVSVREFEEYLLERIHRAEGFLVHPSSAAVGMEFEYAQAGVRHTYRVERRWEKQGDGLKHGLTILRDEKPLDELDKAQADDFLRDLIPPGVSQLFFFDGEKIQQLAESERDHISLAEAIRGLIGLELLDRLQGDLRVYASRSREASNGAHTESNLETLVAERRKLEELRRQKVAELDECQANCDRIRQQVAREEQRLARTGGGFAKQRDGLLAEKAQLEQAIDDAEDGIRELCDGLLPFTLASGLCRDLQRQLKKEAELISRRLQGRVLQERLAEIKSKIGATLTSNLEAEKVSAGARKKVLKKVMCVLDELTETQEDPPETLLVHNLSEQDHGRLVGAIERILTELPKRLTTLQKRLERSVTRLRQVETALEKIPKDDVLQPVLERIRDLHRELGGSQASVDRAGLAVRETDLKIQENARQAKKAEEKSKMDQKAVDRVSMVLKVQSALDDYVRALTGSKVQELREAVVGRFSQLWRKGDLVRRIDIDPAAFSVALYDRHDRLVPKQQLSAGEKQIYAIAMLWALGQVSGRPLPIVIDTPLGRLDSDHRAHLVQRYFPHASHQVIILSTDTEIDQTFFRDLGPHISHCYHLQYDVNDARCVVEKGYFWSVQDREVASAAQ